LSISPSASEIVPELVYFLDQKFVQKQTGIRIGLRFEPIAKVSDVFPRDKLVYDPLRAVAVQAGA